MRNSREVVGAAIYGESDLDLLTIPSEKLDWYSILEHFQLLDKEIVLHIPVADNESFRTLIEVAKKEV